MALFNTLRTLSQSFTRLSLTKVVQLQPKFNQVKTPLLACIHTTVAKNDLMEFFDDKKYWGDLEIKVGRAWRLDELRIKSNDDLHKLWYILLKERNMLFTMEVEHENKVRHFPNAERIDKVQESMSNVEKVVRERNAAYHMLETGEDGERPVIPRFNAMGLKFTYRMREYSIPKFMNTFWKSRHFHYYRGHAVRKFLLLYREKLYNTKRRERRKREREVQMLFRKFPNMNIDNLKMEYPDVNIEKARNNQRSIGHYVREK